MKYLDTNTNTYKEIHVKASGDTLPIGAVVEYDGSTVPEGYEIISDTTYSTTEHKTGENWIDGKPLYRKVITATNITISKSTTIAHGISNIDKISPSTSGVLRDTSANSNCMFPLIQNSGTILNFIIVGSNIVFRGNESYTASATRTYEFTLEYTKTTD